MKTLVLDAFSGISGDMFLGAMFDLGLSKKAFQKELDRLHISGYKIEVVKTSKSAIGGTNFDVILADHQHKDNGITEHGHHHGRSFKTISELILNSDLSASVKDRAIDLFMQVAEAEAKVHQLPIDEIHFHEVGALDSIVDLVGAAIAIDLLGIEHIIVNNLTDGTGTIKIAHGVVPVPVPAVLQMQIAANIPLKQRFDVNTELITPTGMAIVKSLADDFNTTCDGVLEKVGYGFGKKDTGSFNALRVSLYNSLLTNQNVTEDQDNVLLLETNLDDLTGVELADIAKAVLELGANDAWSEPIVMKKGRPAYKFCCLVDSSKKELIVKYLFEHSTAIGIRYQDFDRSIMKRSLKELTTIYGKIHVKELSYQGITKFSLEHDELKKIAKENNKSINTIKEEILLEMKKGI